MYISVSKSYLLIMLRHEDSYKNKGARKKLVALLAEKGIKDSRVLNAILKIPRHFFFDKTFESHAYDDKAFPIGEGQTISQPYTVAYQTQLLHVQKNDKVLEIGTGSGYQTCVLAEMGANVYSIERHESLSKKAQIMLNHFGYLATLLCGDGTKGWPEEAPFDKIIVTAGAPVVPKQLAAQLAVGGVMVIPVGDEKVQQMLTIVRKSEKLFEKIVMDNFKFVPLIGENGWK
jgi:protein-L-isoaspartate(D-aspartate) O-methyltransferase